MATNGLKVVYQCKGIDISVESELKSKTKSIYLLIISVEAKPSSDAQSSSRPVVQSPVGR